MSCKTIRRGAAAALLGSVLVEARSRIGEPGLFSETASTGFGALERAGGLAILSERFDELARICNVAPGHERWVKCVGSTSLGIIISLAQLLVQRRSSKNGPKVQRAPPLQKPEPECAVAHAQSCAGCAEAPTVPEPAPPGRGPRLFSAGLSEAQRAIRQVKSILNKLARDRFETLYAQLLLCCSTAENREEIIEVVAQEVFAKATAQHLLIELYADVCVRLRSDLEQLGNASEVCFKRSLVGQCQQSFTRYLQPPRVDAQLDREEQYEELVKYKTAMLGNVLLVGHLLQRKMLNPTLVFYCTDRLLAVRSPETLETLCVFLETLGAAFDTSDWKGFARLDDVFANIEDLSADSTQTLRTQCLLKDLLDKRRCRWGETRPAAELPSASARHTRRTERRQGETPLRSGAAAFTSAFSGLAPGAATLPRPCDWSAGHAEQAERADAHPGLARRRQAAPVQRQREVLPPGPPAHTPAQQEQCKSKDVAAAMRQRTGGPRGKYLCRYLVCIEQDSSFQVCKRLIGSKGENMKSIIAKAPDAKIRIRGQGSKYLEGPRQVESSDLLMICVSSTSLDSFDTAAELVAELLATVHAEYREFCRSRGRVPPALEVRRD